MITFIPNETDFKPFSSLRCVLPHSLPSSSNFAAHRDFSGSALFSALHQTNTMSVTFDRMRSGLFDLLHPPTTEKLLGVTESLPLAACSGLTSDLPGVPKQPLT